MRLYHVLHILICSWLALFDETCIRFIYIVHSRTSSLLLIAVGYSISVISQGYIAIFMLITFFASRFCVIHLKCLWKFLHMSFWLTYVLLLDTHRTEIVAVCSVSKINLINYKGVILCICGYIFLSKNNLSSCIYLIFYLLSILIV